MLTYTKFPKIDAHIHVNVKNQLYIEVAKAHNVHLITINTDAAVFPSMNEQESVALHFQENHPQYFSYIAGFSMSGWKDKDWLGNVTSGISRSIKNGAVGVKIWKNIGMDIRKENGDFLMVDDASFSPIFRFLANNKIPLLAHLSEPKNCWLPLKKMTTYRNRIYYSKHPEFHMFLHPEFPSYEQHIKSRNNILEQYPDLNFIGAHLGSLEWDYKILADHFDLYPNFQVDISSRLNHLQLQSIKDHAGVRAFFLKYADRILYGTDAMDNVHKMEKSYQDDWLFFTTDKLLESEDIDGQFKGLNLPEDVLKKLYYNNALRYYSALRNRLEYI